MEIQGLGLFRCFAADMSCIRSEVGPWHGSDKQQQSLITIAIWARAG